MCHLDIDDDREDVCASNLDHLLEDQLSHRDFIREIAFDVGIVRQGNIDSCLKPVMMAFRLLGLFYLDTASRS